MFRTMILTLGATAGLLIPAVLPSTAEAGGPSISIGIGVGRPGYYPPSYYPPSYYPPSYYPPSYYPPPVIAPPVFVPPIIHQHHYDVLYRYSPYESWRLYGTYHSHGRAHDIEDYLESRGFDARILHR